MPVVVEKTYPVSASRLWNALTVNEEMKQWYFELAEFRPEPGFEFEFWAGDDKKKWLHKCRVTTVIPLSVIAYTWRYEGYPGNSEVKFELLPDGQGQTMLRITHTGLETFPQDVPELQTHNFEFGWKQFAEQELSEYLGK
ncbi:SRPBCC family protein [Pollutibacter soli]|uniref:SRPBCC family protein n=1 Tax=Pollutibacter soli TaxID=3034157 RepID=UPI003013D178